MPTAVLFPGQGSQTSDMRDLVAAEAPDLLERAGDEPFARASESTEFAQPAIFCASVAGWRRLERELDTAPAAVSGHSLGEFAALVAADAIDAADALGLVTLRGRLMAQADTGGTMLALLGATDERAEELADEHDVSVANFNAPGQVVLSGPVERLDQVAEHARDEGLKALELGVAGAFHSPAMAAAVSPFAAALEDAPFRKPLTAVFSCLTAAPMTDPRRDLALALTGPVRWTDTVRALAERGIDTFVDAGPGRVLQKLVKRIVPEASRA